MQPESFPALLAELDELWRPTRAGFRYSEVGTANHLKITHSAMTHEWARRSPEHRRVTIADLEDLADAGLIRVTGDLGPQGRRGDLRLTAAGERQADEFRASSAPLTTPVHSDWETTVLPLLRAAHELERSLAPMAGLTPETLNAALGRHADDPATATALIQLSSAGYLRDEISVDGVDAPIHFRLGEKALQQVARWPGGSENLSDELLGLIDQRLGDPDVADDERHRLRRLRDAVTDVGTGVITSLIAGVIKLHTGV